MRADRAVNQCLGSVYDFCLHCLLHFPHSVRRGGSGKGSPKNMSKIFYVQAVHWLGPNRPPPERASEPVDAASGGRALPPQASSTQVLLVATTPGKATGLR